MTLEDWLRQDRSLPDQLKVIEGFCSALNEAHKDREVHRALEPGNVEVASDGTCDLSAATSGAPSPRYRAPEVAEGGPPSPEADIYSAGVIFYEMLAGRSPSGERPTPLSDLRPDVSRDLTDAIMGCLERGPDWRPKDLSYLIQVVGSMRSAGVRATSRPSPRPSEPARPSAARAGGGASRGRGSTSSSNVPLYALATILLVAAGAGGWWYMSQGGQGGSPGPVVPAPVRPAPATQATPPPPTAAPTPVVPTPKPSVETRPTPAPITTPPLSLVPVARATPTPEPPRVATPPPATPPPTTATPPPITVATPPPPTEPAVLTAVSPLTVKRGITTMLDVRGSGLRADHQARIVRVKEAVTGVSVVRQKWVDPTLIKVLVNIEASAAPGAYGVALVDAQGTHTNGPNFTVVK